MKIYKNFLPEKEFKIIKDMFYDKDFPWYYSPILIESSKNKKYDFQFVHLFYDRSNVNSNFFKNFEFFLKFIKAFSLLRLKANLLPQTSKNIEGGMHTDYSNKNFITTGILYINNNNGYTRFENGKIIKSEENKYVEFNSNIKHTGSTCTDQHTRIVLNVNYVKEETYD